ncbi:hypothetical protein KAU11_04775, partial [Candidatus Babeliales bacterium]|nr:hypothetical protein [Candidatus Babeliales bacterium]
VMAHSHGGNVLNQALNLIKLAQITDENNRNNVIKVMAEELHRFEVAERSSEELLSAGVSSNRFVKKVGDRLVVHGEEQIVTKKQLGSFLARFFAGKAKKIKISTKRSVKEYEDEIKQIVGQHEKTIKKIEFKKLENLVGKVVLMGTPASGGPYAPQPEFVKNGFDLFYSPDDYVRQAFKTYTKKGYKEALKDVSAIKVEGTDVLAGRFNPSGIRDVKVGWDVKKKSKGKVRLFSLFGQKKMKFDHSDFFRKEMTQAICARLVRKTVKGVTTEEYQDANRLLVAVHPETASKYKKQVGKLVLLKAGSRERKTINDAINSLSKALIKMIDVDFRLRSVDSEDKFDAEYRKKQALTKKFEKVSKIYSDAWKAADKVFTVVGYGDVAKKNKLETILKRTKSLQKLQSRRFSDQETGIKRRQSFPAGVGAKSPFPTVLQRVKSWLFSGSVEKTQHSRKR